MDSGIQSAGDMAMTQAIAPKLGKLGSGNMDKASKDFESMFMSQMLQPMFEGMDVNPLFGGGNGEKIMRGFLVQEYGKLAAKGSHLGIADAVKSEMIRAQSAGTKSASATTNVTSGGQDVATP
jgi:flagellar protein FlgJ